MTPHGRMITEKLRRADDARVDGPDSWWRAAWETHRQFAGRFTVDGSAHAEGAVTMNLQYAATRTLHAGILPKRLRLKCKAVIPSEEPAAHRATILGQWAFHRNKMLSVMDTVELNGQTKGLGISYTTWGNRMTPVMTSKNGQMEAMHPKGKKGTTDSPEIEAEIAKVFPHRLNRAKMPRTFSIDPFDFLCDPEATCPDDLRWAAHRYYLTRKEAMELLKVKFFTCKAEDLTFSPDLPSTKMLSDMEDLKVNESRLREMGIDQEDLGDFERWEAWAYHDFVDNTITHIITGMDVPARDPQPIPEWFRPYHFYAPNSTGDTIWTKPDAWMYFPAQQALNRVMNAMVHYTDFMGKGLWFVPEGQEGFADRLAEAQAGEGIAVPPEVAAFWQRIGKISMEFGKVPEAIRDLKPELSAIITQMSAVSEVGQGLMVKGVTATQASLSAGSQSLRSGYNRSLLMQWASDVAELTIQLLQNLFTQEQAIPILGVEQAAQWGPDVNVSEGGDFLLDVSKDQIQGHFDYEVLAGDNADQVRVEQQNMAMQAANLLAQFIPTGLVDPQVLLPWLADKFEIPPEVIHPVPRPQPGPAAGQAQPVNRPGEAGPGQPPVGDLQRRQGNPSMANELGATQRTGGPSAV